MGTAGILFALAAVCLSALVFLQVKPIFEVPPVPKVEDTWWGPGSPSKTDTAIRPFKINVSDEVLKDLQQRLANALPFQTPLEGVQQQYGMNTELLKNITDYWRTQYNWREREKFLNQYPQFKVNIQGLDIHYIHVKPTETKGKKVLPLLLLHGWPGSVREFYEIIPLLTSPQKGKEYIFEVIIPSLPGFGFSDAAVRPGLGDLQMAVVFKNLMQRLGFEKYYLQGGNWGAIIVTHIAILYPEKVIAVHSNLCFFFTPMSTLMTLVGSFFPSLVVRKEEESKMYPLSEKYGFLLSETGYMHIQATKPDTIGTALRDSPVGLAAYILEKFTTWTNRAWRNLDDGGLTKKYTLTNVLDNVMIYWVTGSITTAMRLYAETFNKDQFSYQMDNIPVEIPTGCARFSYDLGYQAESILRGKFKKLIHVTDYEGGDFAAFELPITLAEDVYHFVEKVEKL